MNNFSFNDWRSSKLIRRYLDFFLFLLREKRLQSTCKNGSFSAFPPLIIFLLVWIKMQEGTVLSTGEGGEVPDGEEGMFPGPLPEHWWSVEVKR